jgi:putative Mg2+ transporter-C (MgtC) family protein
MYWEIVLKLFLAMILGGVIGLEREIGNRPAGFRTHTLVCMGSVLVMLTSQYVYQAYGQDVDLTRLGAQVISGIGFLGAGTILKDGSRVRGLTTAASLWVVACIGLAIGIGFYWGALATAVLSYITLVLLKRLEGHLIKSPRRFDINLEIPNVPGQVAAITQVMARLDVQVRDIRVANGDGERV